MATCEVCGNDYDRAMEIRIGGAEARTFDSFECAIHALAPTCDTCGVRIVGHGQQAGGRFFCCSHCAEHAGVEGTADRV